MKVCPRCGSLMPSRGRSLCAACEAKRRAESDARRDRSAEYAARAASEDPRYRSFYRSKQWRALSRQYAVDHHHRCERCGRVGTDVHHVEPIQTPAGWARRLDYGNLRLLCVGCHNKEHGRFGHAAEG